MRVVGDRDNESEGTVRVPWPDDMTLEEALEEAAKKACAATKTREVWKIA